MRNKLCTYDIPNANNTAGQLVSGLVNSKYTYR